MESLEKVEEEMNLLSGIFSWSLPALLFFTLVFQTVLKFFSFEIALSRKFSKGNIKEEKKNENERNEEGR